MSHSLVAKSTNKSRKPEIIWLSKSNVYQMIEGQIVYMFKILQSIADFSHIYSFLLDFISTIVFYEHFFAFHMKNLRTFLNLALTLVLSSFVHNKLKEALAPNCLPIYDQYRISRLIHSNIDHRC